MKITHAQLRGSQNLFAGETSNDYLRVRIGTGNPLSIPTRVVYVDDIVCRPAKRLQRFRIR